jgi:Predicted acetyltransferase
MQACSCDPRPVRWPIEHPYWITGEDDTRFYLEAWAHSEEEIRMNWPDACKIETLTENEPGVFSPRRPCPDWYLDERMGLLRKIYVIFAPHWSWGTAFVLFRKDGAGFVHFNVYDNGDIPSISDLFVQEGCRRKGVGSELLRDVEELARLRGHGSVSLWADPGGWCRGWYHRLGYRETPEMDTTPSGDIWMIKDFTKPI